MNISEAVAGRFSARAFLSRAPEDGVVRRILERALRASSGGNLQPRHAHALTGAPFAALIGDIGASIASGTREAPYYCVYPVNLLGPPCARRFEVDEDFYASLGVARSDEAEL